MINSLARTCLLFYTLSLFVISTGVAQIASEVIHVKDLPPEGFLLDKGWKFKVGDSPEYAAAGYDDSGWESINPTLDIHDDLPQIPEGNVCWIRIHLSIDSTVSQLVMVMQQSVASEIYLNGRLIHRLGVLDPNPDKIKAINPNGKPFSFFLDKGGQQLLAIRFVKQPGIGYGTHWNSSNPALRITLNTVEKATAYYNRTHEVVIELDHFRTGIFFILGVLYLAFYVFYPVQRANLLFSIYAILQVLVWGTFILVHKTDVIETYPFTKNSLLVLQVAGHIILLLAVYELLKQQKDWIFYGLVVLALVCIPLGFFGYDWGWKIYGKQFTHIYNLAIAWIAFRAFRNNVVATVIIAIGSLCFMLIWVAFTQGWTIVHGPYLFSIAHLSVPLAVSLYLGYEFARTNRSLQQKLTEVSTLSEEKQQILTNQNETLEKQVTERTAALKTSMDELKSTQTQLIQSEKMASLGELTAGIAHEIQNPLNFVNNFAEVNQELIVEMDDAIRNGKLEEVKGIAKNIADNQEKINQHGKRADAIVKNMLQHSRKSSGQKELTDINALCEEYLRLAYHGFRAKDNAFIAKFEIRPDLSLEKINLVPDEIGRVVLNLINNAFYAVNGLAAKVSAEKQYSPTVIVSTRNLGHKIEISVKDNGMGMPEKIKEKIFQPFFTTKPVGQGTGLGLSLSYDIVKAQGGELRVETIEGEGSEFTVSLPV
jgi:two-component system NtrC family sensor kinase